jgi:putative ABC transport system permease protein
MFKNYIMIAIRNLRRQKGYSFINILGLAIGMACCLLILLYVQDEFGYDKFHEKSDRIYRLVMEGQVSATGRLLNSARSPSPWAPVLAADYPGVVNYVRFKTPLSRWLITYEDERIYEKGFYFADATVFDVFDFELVRGNPAEVLVAPNTVVISEETARKYFGNEDPVGKIITADLVYEFKITGVMKKVPRRSHMTFDFLASFATLTGPANSEGAFIYGADLSNFQFFGLNPQVYTYLLLDDGFSAEDFELLLPQFIDKYLGEGIRQFGIQLDPYLQPLTAVHLHSNLDAEVAPNSDISYVYIFSAISLFILMIACINFMNLATARSANRALEVGLRKVVGSDRFQLVKQFLGESVFLAFLALLLAIVFVYLLLPPFNVLSGKELVFAFDNTWIFPALIGIVLFVGIVAGSYPAFFLSSFKPVSVLKGAVRAGAANMQLRRILVVGQFAISIIFIIGTGIVYSQLDFILNRRLGFNKEQVAVIPMVDPPARFRYMSYKSELSQSPDILAVSASNSVPGGLIDIAILQPEGIPEGENVSMEQLMIEYDFIKTLGIELAQGRDFSLSFPTDTMEAFIINETAVRQLGWEESPLNKRMEMGNFKQGRVIGVVRDFHVKSLHQKIEPLVLHLAPSPDPFLNLLVRIRPENIRGALGFMEEKWRQVYPTHPFEYSFLDEDFDSLYRSEQLRGKIFIAFSLLAIFTACLGLFGLASFTAEQRTKEIGIRRVLGASVTGIVGLLSKEFVKWVLLANVIAWPIAYFAMKQWLQNFAYQTNLNPGIFVSSGIIALIIALMTVSYQSIRAAVSQPVEALKYE